MPQEKDKYMEIGIFIMFRSKYGHVDWVWCLLASMEKFNHDDDGTNNHDDGDADENDVPKS